MAACSCGWRGGTHPADEGGYDAAVDEWEAEHARPLVAATVPAETAGIITAAQEAIAHLAGERPEAARYAVEELGRWAELLGGALEAQAIPLWAERQGVPAPTSRRPTRGS